MISKSHFVEECDSFSVLGQKYHLDLDPSRTRHSINLLSSLAGAAVSSSMAEIDGGSDCGGINTILAAAPCPAAHMAVSQHRALAQCHMCCCNQQNMDS